MTSGLLNHRGCGLLALLVALAPPLLLPAAPPANDPARRVRISVVVILASETNADVDPRLTCIANEVKKRHPQLKGFRVAKVCYKSMPVGACESFELVGDQIATITVQGCAVKHDRVRLKVDPPSMGEITYSTPCGKFLPILTPLRTKKNELLIFGVRVQPCKGK
jgi:hypothetical protein